MTDFFRSTRPLPDTPPPAFEPDVLPALVGGGVGAAGLFLAFMLFSASSNALSGDACAKLALAGGAGGFLLNDGSFFALGLGAEKNDESAFAASFAAAAAPDAGGTFPAMGSRFTASGLLDPAVLTAAFLSGCAPAAFEPGADSGLRFFVLESAEEGWAHQRKRGRAADVRDIPSVPLFSAALGPASAFASMFRHFFSRLEAKSLTAIFYNGGVGSGTVRYDSITTHAQKGKSEFGCVPGGTQPASERGRRQKRFV